MSPSVLRIAMNGVTGRMGYRQHLVRSILSIRDAGGVECPDGSRVQVEPILVGPEHHFYGGSASGEMEWWDHRRTHCLFFAAGGGIGWLDSKGHEVKGGQGEDFNFNWLLYPGVRFMFRHRLSASVGLYFQHVSNRYLNSVNPGLNAIGPMVSVGWHY